MTRKPAQPDPGGSPGEGEDLDFDRAVAHVEEVIRRIESGELGLEESLAEYERAAKLVRRCRDALQRAELRIREISEAMLADDQGGSAGRDD